MLQHSFLSDVGSTCDINVLIVLRCSEQVQWTCMGWNKTFPPPRVYHVWVKYGDVNMTSHPSTARTEGLQDEFNNHMFRTKASHIFLWISAVVNQPGEGWAPLGCKSALDTP